MNFAKIILLIGKTKEVDMVFTRANNVVRLKVACLEPSAIPDHTYDVVGCMLQFSNEADNGGNEVMDDVDPDDALNGDGRGKDKKNEDNAKKPESNLRWDTNKEKEEKNSNPSDRGVPADA